MSAMDDVRAQAILHALATVEEAVVILRRMVMTAVATPNGQVTLDRSCQGKRSYRTPEAAGNAAATRGGGLRVYRCPFCQRFHLTKADLSDFAERIS